MTDGDRTLFLGLYPHLPGSAIGGRGVTGRFFQSSGQVKLFNEGLLFPSQE